MKRRQFCRSALGATVKKNPLGHTALLTGLTMLAHPLQIVVTGVRCAGQR